MPWTGCRKVRHSRAGRRWALLGGLAFAGIAVARPPESPAGHHQVLARRLAFDPPVVTVAPGDTVTWTNEDPVPHTVSDDAATWDSGELPRGGSLAISFPETGRFTYSCRYHPTMTATVVVQGSAPAESPIPDVRPSASAKKEHR